jgi:hypothetical protein
VVVAVEDVEDHGPGDGIGTAGGISSLQSSNMTITLRQALSAGLVLKDPSDGVDGVGDGCVAVHGLSFAPQFRSLAISRAKPASSGKNEPKIAR